VELKLGEIRSTDASHPFAWITITNESERSLGISKSFYTFGEYIYLEIEALDGSKKVPYPGGEQDVFTSPDFSCLDPGQAMEVGIDLLSWQALVGGVPDSPPQRFDVPPGGYRARAVYSTDWLKLKSARSRCKPFRGTIESDWEKFEVKE
jgi:hypothetical protein